MSETGPEPLVAPVVTVTASATVIHADGTTDEGNE